MPYTAILDDFNSCAPVKSLLARGRPLFVSPVDTPSVTVHFAVSSDVNSPMMVVLLFMPIRLDVFSFTCSSVYPLSNTNLTAPDLLFLFFNKTEKSIMYFCCLLNTGVWNLIVTSFVCSFNVWFLDSLIPSLPSMSFVVISSLLIGFPLIVIFSYFDKPEPFTKVALEISPKSSKSLVDEKRTVQSIESNSPPFTIGEPETSM